MRVKKSLPIVMAIMFALILSTIPIAKASPVYPHWYALSSIDATSTGVYTSITNDQDDLSHVSGEFINKEMWLGFSNLGWIEVGTTLGPVDNSDGYVSDWHGHFFAYYDTTSYHERNVGSQYPTGSHNFQISRDTSNGVTQWTVYVDFTRVGTVPAITETTGIDQDVGIESTDSSNSFTSGTYASAMQYRNTSGTWVTWNSASSTPTTYSNGSGGWAASYSSSNNRITYTH